MESLRITAKGTIHKHHTLFDKIVPIGAMDKRTCGLTNGGEMEKNCLRWELWSHIKNTIKGIKRGTSQNGICI